MTPQQIKQVLVQLAAEDKLPLDMNDLDESVFSTYPAITDEDRKNAAEWFKSRDIPAEVDGDCVFITVGNGYVVKITDDEIALRSEIWAEDNANF